MVLVAIFPVATCPAHAEDGAAHKSVKVCNGELAERAAEIEKAGETPAAFFHACWTRAKPGKPTPIEAGARVEKGTETEPPARRTRTVAVSRAKDRIVTRRRRPPAAAFADEAPIGRAPVIVERGERLDATVSPTFPLPPPVATTADTLGRALRAAGLPPIQVPVLVPGTLDVVPITLAPR